MSARTVIAAAARTKPAAPVLAATVGTGIVSLISPAAWPMLTIAAAVFTTATVVAVVPAAAAASTASIAAITAPVAVRRPSTVAAGGSSPAGRPITVLI